MEKIAILVGGDLGLSLRRYIEDQNIDRVVGVFDDSGKAMKGLDDLEILGGSGDVEALYKKGAFQRLAFAIGYKNFAARVSLFQNAQKQKIPLKGVIHPSTYVHPKAKIGEGVHIFPGSIIDFDVRLADNIVINTGSTIAHHSIVGSHVYFGPGVRVAGLTEIGTRCFVGIGSTLVEKIRIGEGSTIAAGAVVTDNVAPYSLMAGVPAVLKKKLA